MVKTRSKWDDFYRNQYSELKRKKNQECDSNTQKKKPFINVDDSKYIVFDSISGETSGEKQCVKIRGSRNVGSEKKLNYLASEKTRESYGEAVLDRQIDVEQVVSNDSCLKTGPESRSGPGSKRDSLDEVVSSTTKKVDSGGNNGRRGRERPRKIDPLNAKQTHQDDVCVDKVSLDEPNVSESDQATSEDDDDDDAVSDEDYRVGEYSSRESSDDSSSASDVEIVEEDDEYENEDIKQMSSNVGVRKEGERKTDDVVIIINGKETISSVRIETNNETEVDDGYCEANDGNDCDKLSVNWENDKQKCDPVWKIAKEKEKGDGGLDVYSKMRNIFGSDKEEINLKKCGRYNSSSMDDENNFDFDRVVKEKNVKVGKKSGGVSRKLDLIKTLVEYMNAPKDQQSKLKMDSSIQNALPTRFCFEDEILPPYQKSEWEKHIESLFCNLELGLRESEINSTTSTSSTMENDDEVSGIEIDESPAARCERGEHELILDEQMGILCKYCFYLVLEIKHVLPPFYTRPSARQEMRKDLDEPSSPFTGEIQFPGGGTCDSDSSHVKGTVWDLIPGVQMFPHQRDGFEFIWRNIAGDIVIKNLEEEMKHCDGRGCIISHAPGTGKTRLTIVFLQTFLKLYPTCCPVILAPRGMLLTWEQECIKWKFNVPFLNLNKSELSGYENALGSQIFGQVGSGVLSKEVIRLLKLYSWTRGGGILGLSYTLFMKLAGENGKEGVVHDKIRDTLLQRPGLLVLDEGHTPRNNKTRIWDALTKVATQRRIILSGTPFQNNVTELYNTLCLVNPKFVNQIRLENAATIGNDRKRWTSFMDSIGKTKDGLKKLRAMLDPFVHVYKGTILQDELPGLSHSLVFLHPSQHQTTLLKLSSKEKVIFRRIRMVSLVSIHPSLEAVMERYASHKSKLEEIESDIEAGVKANFIMKLIWLADALGERVLIFSQFIDPLVFLKKQIESHLSWREGRELLYMDGQLDELQRQESITSFNDDTSVAKVLLASERACSEGINLVGASRVVLLDTVWNPFVEKQAISRAYRFGQKKFVYVYRLFTSGIEVKQYAQQLKKVRLSELIFSLGDEEAEQSGKPEDKVLEAMLNLDKFNQIFEKIIHQPKASDLIEIFELK